MKLTGEMSRRRFVATAAAAAGAAMVPNAALGLAQDPVQNTVVKDGKKVSREQVPWKLLPFPMTQVRLLDGPFKVAQEANRKYLHYLPPDRLLHSFRLTAGMPSAAEPLGG